MGLKGPALASDAKGDVGSSFGVTAKRALIACLAPCITGTVEAAGAKESFVVSPLYSQSNEYTNGSSYSNFPS